MHELNDGSDANPHEPGIDDTQTAPKRPHIARRRYVVDARRQYKSAALICGLALFLLVTFNIAFGIMRSSQSMVLSAAAPQLRSVLEDRDARTGMMLMAASVIFIGGVFVITILETHRTVGSIYAMRRRLVQAQHGDLDSPLRFRQGDTLTDLIEPFNDLITTLRERAHAEADELDRIADEAGEESPVAGALRELAQRRREPAV